MYAFVIRPNHLHFVWQMLDMNGKEMPHDSFLKFTALAVKKELRRYNPEALKLFAVDAENKDPIAIVYEFWQRDSLAFELTKKETISQKINYTHYNPTAEVGNYVVSLSNIIIPLQNFMKVALMTLGF